MRSKDSTSIASRSGDAAIPVGERLSDLVRRVLLDEVEAAHCHLGLVGPAAAELAFLRRDSAGLGVYEQLRNGTRAQPLAVRADDFHYVDRMLLDRQLARPGERRPTCLARPAERSAVSLHLGIRERT